MPLSQFTYPQGYFVAIIDVQGFYRDEHWTNAIKLHYEENLYTPELLNDSLTQDEIQNCALSFSHKLKTFTEQAYTNIRQTLDYEQHNGKVYSSDTFWV